MADEDLIALSANLAASKHPGVLLIDTPAYSKYTKAFLASFRPEQVVPIGSFPDGTADLKKRLGVPVALDPGVETWDAGCPGESALPAWPVGWSSVRPSRVVCCCNRPILPAFFRPRCSSFDGNPEESAQLRHWLKTWQVEEVHAVGAARALCQENARMFAISIWRTNKRWRRPPCAG